VESSEYPVLVENSPLAFGDEGAATIIENRPNGLHRIPIDIKSAEYSEIRFLVRPAGRRRLRLDFAKGATMIGRAHVLLTPNSKADVAIGAMNCLEPISKSSEKDNKAGELDEAKEVLCVVYYQWIRMRRCHCIQAKKRSTSQRRM
jgi:hypothetical protein